MSRSDYKSLKCAECGAQYSTKYTPKIPRCPNCKRHRANVMEARNRAAKREKRRAELIKKSAEQSQDKISKMAVKACAAHMTYGEYVAKIEGAPC